MYNIHINYTTNRYACQFGNINKKMPRVWGILTKEFFGEIYTSFVELELSSVQIIKSCL